MLHDTIRTPTTPESDDSATDGGTIATGESAAPDRAALVRALRELESAKGRVERDAKLATAEMQRDLVLKILPVLDNLDRTIKAAAESGDAPSVVEGVHLVRSQMEGVLRGYGVERIDAVNRRFDPKVHEAISTLPVMDPAVNGLVLDQVEPGYRFGDSLLRPARVVVAKFTSVRAPTTVRWH
ncbi:MAG: nucleotide exchange factor GrpE [Kofleriaceae bacterium]